MHFCYINMVSKPRPINTAFDRVVSSAFRARGLRSCVSFSARSSATSGESALLSWLALAGSSVRGAGVNLFFSRMASRQPAIQRLR